MAGISKGAAGEVLAVRFLRSNGYQVLGGNYRCRYGEIDLVAQNKEYLVFVEVKSREEDAYFRPSAAVTADKQRRIIKTALHFIARYPNTRQMRFDVIEIITAKGEPMKALEINHIQDAYGG